MRKQALRILAGTAVLAAITIAAAAQSAPAKISPHWNRVVRVSRTTATLQVVVNPPLRPGTPIHDSVYRALKSLGAEYVRYVPWLPYPKLGVAELEPPTAQKTSWDFSLIDPMTMDFLNATQGHQPILNFSTIPQWMFKTTRPVAYPADPNQVTWSYEQGNQLRDPGGKEVGDYYARLVSWYTKGGFRDENGKWHASGHHFAMPWWEVLNEVDFEHHLTPQQYTHLYDAIVSAIHKVDPQTKFVGMALAAPSGEPAFFEYFLNPAHHQPGIPLDMISYHFYASPADGESPQTWQYSVFDQADGFFHTVRYVESIRKRLSPHTKTDIDEIGIIDNALDGAQGHAGPAAQPIPNSYWNLCAAEYAYIYGNLAQIGIDVAGESQLVGYPTQFPSVSMVDWNTGQPNARFWALQMIKNNFGPGDKIVDGHGTQDVYVLAVITPQGRRRLLVVNKRVHPVEVSIAGASGGTEEVVDQSTAFHPAARRALGSDTVTLGGFAVAAVTLAGR